MKKLVMMLIALAVAVSPALAGNKKRIAVMDFEDKAQGQHAGWRSPGKGMADMLVTALAKSNKYSVIEREQLEKVLKEQRLGAAGIITAQTAAKIGQLLGIQYIVTGSITEFGIKESKLGVGNLGNVFGFGGGVDTKTNTAKVACDVRMIDTSTGEIIKSEKGEGEESSTGVSVDLSVAPSVDFGKAGFDETVIGKAVRKTIESVSRPLIEMAEKFPWTARIMKIDGNKLWLNSGKIDEEREGRTFGIFRKGEDLVDPETGLALGSSDTKLGTGRITKVEEKYSIAETDAKGVTKEDYVKEER
ncbi:MAG: CsgG/HfaB family protein [Candidatus Firestonebacteria bacterium]